MDENALGTYVVGPFPRNVHPQHNAGPRAARARAISKKMVGLETFVDAAQYGLSGKFAVTAVSEKGDLMSAASAASGGISLYQLGEKRDVARLQYKVQNALRQRSDLPMASELVARLDAELVDATRLYGEYADPYDLVECKLAIVCSSGYNKPELVESLWESLLEREFLAHTNANELCRRLESLAQEHAESVRFFPIAFVVKFLEVRGSQHGGFEPGWILEPLLAAKVSISSLRDTYNDLYRGDDHAFLERPLHLLRAISRLIELFLKNWHSTEGRRQLANKFVDDISDYIRDLHTLTPTDNVVSLIAKFNELQATLHSHLAT
ncbi:hypothetical protein HPB50_010652 [Hyalomma asiaticum]|uniref:Uncharacterized protein n=1 Tax=Hyalomma asiaticum TaxID=266040 RepID=A0ACB7T955_HYAAI|nr:hypothetical protein HPB50_010652 [Hyalomma asiaticum]